MAALHERLKPWQRILLGIFCFPLLPFYLCVYCLCLKDDKKEEDVEGNKQSSGHENEAKNDTQQNHARLSFINRGFQHHDEENREKKLRKDSNHTEREDRKRKKKPSGKFSYPWDGSSLKSLKIDLKALEKLDHFASKLDTKGTVEQLVQALIRDAKTELEKTRAIWIWICYHIEYDTIGYKNEALRSSDPNEVLRARKGVCAGYASLFQHMCSIAGLQCEEVSGYAKGASYKTGQKISNGTNHAWNTIYLEGSWHLLDSTWGAGHADVNVSKFTYEYNELYFLTHPAIFIMDHLPEEPDCQLLETCLSQEQYEMNVYPKNDFYNFNLVSYHPQTCVIKTVKGKASIAIESSFNIKFSFTLNETEKRGLLKLRDNGMNLDVYPRKTGRHILRIFACREDSDKVLKSIVEYSIDCDSVDTNMIIPKCLNNPVGPNWISQKAGLSNPSHPDPVINTKDGTCMISFALKKDITTYCTLCSDEITLTQEMESRHVFQTQKKNIMEIKVHLPSSGTYVLQVFFKPTNSTSSSYDYLCNYLITCTNTSVTWPVFPFTYGKWDDHFELVCPLEGVLPRRSNVFFKLKITDVAAVCADGKKSIPLTLADSGYWEGTCSTEGVKELFVSVKYINEPNTSHYMLKYTVGDH